MKKIAHMNFAKGFRGGERQTLLLIEALEKRGYHQKVITRANSELANRLEGIKNLHIIRISKPYFFHLHTVKDVVLNHAHETKAAQFALLANLLHGTPYIITRRVDNPVTKFFFNKKMYERAVVTVVLSNAIRKELEKLSKNITFKVIPSSLSRLNIQNNTVEKLRKRFSDKFLIGNIGELDNSHKGQKFLIDAMKGLSRKYPDIHLIMLGKGRDEEKYKLQAKGLTNITFEGFVNNVGDYIQCLDLFVFPSLHEGLGSILLDIIQHRVPIIASDTGGIPDIITNEKNGLLIKTKSSQAIHDAVEHLYLDPTLAETLAEEAFNGIGEYSPEVMADRYERIYWETDKKIKKSLR